MTERAGPGGTHKTLAEQREVSTLAEERFVPALAAVFGAYGSGMIPMMVGIFLAG